MWNCPLARSLSTALRQLPSIRMRALWLSVVANPVALMVATLGLLLANVNVIPLIGFPYWSTPLAANC